MVREAGTPPSVNVALEGARELNAAGEARGEVQVREVVVAASEPKISGWLVASCGNGLERDEARDVAHDVVEVARDAREAEARVPVLDDAPGAPRPTPPGPSLLPTTSKSFRCCSRTSASALTLHAISFALYFSGANRIIGAIGSFL